MKHWLAIEKLTTRNAISERLAYRLDFALSTIFIGVSQIVIPLYTLLLYGVSEGFPGWSVGEALLLASYVSLAEATASVFFSGIIWQTLRNVRQGTMDTYLLAPANPLSYLINRSVDVEDSGCVAFSAAMCAYALYLMQAPWWFIVFLVGYLIVPVALFAAIAITASAISIRYVDTWRVYDVIHSIGSLAKYPNTIYPQLAQTFLLTAFPVAVAGYVPLAALLHQASAWLFLSSAFVVAILALSVYYWQTTLKNYASAGG